MKMRTTGKAKQRRGRYVFLDGLLEEAHLDIVMRMLEHGELAE